MLKRILFPLLLASLFCVQALARQGDSPKLTPAPSTAKQSQMIREGIGLHDRGDYDGAVRKYEEVLAENPDNVFALYEMSFAYFAKGDYKKSLEIGYKGAQYKSDLLSRFYQTIGNNLDQLGEPKKAVEAYKAGIKLAPDEGLLHYNLALTYLNLKKPEEARKSLKTAAALNPKHASSQLALAAQFFNNGYRTPALFAAARFLVLEPRTRRSEVALKVVREVLGGGVSAGKNPNEINIFVDLNAKKDEGDFGFVDLLFGLSRAVGSTDKNKDKSEIQLIADQFETVLAVVAENDAKKKQGTFVYKYYVPYFVELKQKGFVEPFVYHALQGTDLPGMRQWLEQNKARVAQFLAWSDSYVWPKDVPK